jgi:Protein of unknown function (DUF3575)
LHWFTFDDMIKQPSILLIVLAFFSQLQAQEKQDSLPARKNIIRYNISSAALFGFDKTFILGYERRIKTNQSISVNFGTTALPGRGIGDSEDFEVVRDFKNNGYNFSADYRFYLGKLNKYSAPRGVYVGPYYSLNMWRRQSEWEAKNTGDFVDTKMDVNLHMAGVQLGYQFVFYNRFTLDLVLLGPGVGFYNVKTETEGTLTEEQLEKLQKAVIDRLQQRFPGFNLVLDGKRLDSQGTLTTNSVGFRYLIHIGVAF